jgi:alanine racemase
MKRKLDGVYGPPDLVVEIVSKSNSLNDYVKKLNAYITFGVKEYWIVDPIKKKITVYDNTSDEFAFYDYTFNDNVKSTVFDGLSIDFTQFPKDVIPTRTSEARTWAEINLDNLVFNYNQARLLARGSKVLCVIKADAYGHGAIPAAEALTEAGADRFAVATAEEALQLRRHGIKAPILILGATDPVWVEELSANNIDITVGDPYFAEAYAARLKEKIIGVQLKFDTGMGRIGLRPGSAAEQAAAIAKMPCFSLKGAFSHLAAADMDGERGFTSGQLTLFMKLIDALRQRGVTPPLLHLSNSAAIISHPDARLDMVRPGIMLYGSNPCESAHAELKPVLSLYSRIVQVKTVTVSPPETIGYGRTWRADRETVVAALPIGYADGLHRTLSNRMEVLVHGKRAPQIGRVCMDMCMIDVTDIPGVKTGDRATIIGEDGAERITSDDLASIAGTISYEILCAVGRRVPRVYYKNNLRNWETCYVNML